MQRMLQTSILSYVTMNNKFSQAVLNRLYTFISVDHRFVFTDIIVLQNRNLENELVENKLLTLAIKRVLSRKIEKTILKANHANKKHK